MTAITHADALRPATAQAPRAARAARILSLTRAEVLLLVRNRTTLFNAVALAPLTVAFLAAIGAVPESAAAAAGAMLVTALLALALLIVVYYNLTTTLVARREELVLKRLLTGDVSRTEIVVATATPAVLIMLAQTLLGAVAIAVWFDLPAVQNLAWVVAGGVGGLLVFVLLAVASAGLTRTVETAQLTTLPVLMVATALSGLAVPLHVLPDVVEQVAQWTPMYPVVALLQHGLGAVTMEGAVASGALAEVQQPLAALALWIVLAAWAAGRWVRWEPRR